MIYRYLVATGVLAGALLASTAAMAAPGVAAGNVNMRAGPGTAYAVITTIPAGAPIEVLGCSSWCQIAYGGTEGFVSANYVSGARAATSYGVAAPYAYAAPPVYEDYYGDGYYAGGYYGVPYYDDGYYGGCGPGVSFSFGFDGDRDHGDFRRGDGRHGGQAFWRRHRGMSMGGGGMEGVRRHQGR